MKIIDVVNPERIRRTPDKTIVLLSGGNFTEQEYVIKTVRLNLYIQKKDENLGSYSLITVYMETDNGEIEMIFDEGYRGENALEETVSFLTNHLGMSGLILRSVIQLKNALHNTKDTT